jgi:hypothetical protein
MILPAVLIVGVASLIDELEKRDGKKRFPVPRQCAWCKKFLPSTDVTENPEPLTSHGICPACVEKMKKEKEAAAQ